MVTKEQYNMQLIQENGRRSGVMILSAPGLASMVRRYGEPVPNRELDLDAMGIELMETYEMPDSNDRFELFFRDKGDEEAFIELQLFLGWTDPSRAYYKQPVGTVPVMQYVWVPEDYFWDLSLMLPHEATFEDSEKERPRKTGDDYKLVEYYTMNCSPDRFEVFYSDKKRKDIADVRMSVFLGWTEEK